MTRQIRQGLAGEKIADRIVSLSDPDARPIRTSKIGKPTEVGYVSQLAEVTEHTKLIIPREIAVDGACQPPTDAAGAELGAKIVIIAGRQEPTSRPTRRRLARYDPARRAASAPQTRLRIEPQPPEGRRGRADLTEWSILAYNSDPLSTQAR